MADSIGGSSGPVQQGDPLGEFIERNMPAWEQRQANYDQLVGAFSNPQSLKWGDDDLVAAKDGYNLGRKPSRVSTNAMGAGELPIPTRDALRSSEIRYRNKTEAISDTGAVPDYGDALTSMNGGTAGAGAFQTRLTPAQFGQSMIDMYVKAPINLIPGIVGEVVNGYTGIGNLLAGNGPQVGTLNLRPLDYSNPMAGALGEFGASVVIPGAAAKTADFVADVRAAAAMDNATLGAMPGYAHQARIASRGVAEVELAAHLQAEAKGYKGVKVTENGGPTFAKTEYLYPVESGQSNIVEVTMTGSRRLDFEQANRMANLTNVVHKGFNAPRGYIWHHVDDFEPFTGRSTLQLVRVDAHVATTPHAGSVRQYESYHRTKYR